MYRGTTPTFTFHSDVDLSSASELWVTFQTLIPYNFGEVPKLTKKKSSDGVTVDGSTVTVRLTQGDTLQLGGEKNAQYRVEMQIRALVGEDAIASNMMYTTLGRILEEGEIQ